MSLSETAQKIKDPTSSGFYKRAPHLHEGSNLDFRKSRFVRNPSVKRANPPYRGHRNRKDGPTGKRVATLPAGGPALYYGEDMLGSSRVLTTNTGVVCYDADFYPFGGERAYTNTCPQDYKFEGKERDSETQNDDFGGRYYSWRFARWLSSDWSNVPVAVPYANLTNPQTLNLYAMAADDPETFADLDGHNLLNGLEKLDAWAGTTEFTSSDYASATSAENNDSLDNLEAAQNQSQTQTQQNQQQSNSQNSSDGLNYKKGVPPAKGDLEKVLVCTQSCVGKQLTVTSTNEPLPNGKHGPTTPHGKGEAADLRVNKGDEGKVLQCAANCGAKFGLDERAHPSGHGLLPHVHIQTVPGTRGGRGDLPEPED
jgi:RHS repeat-associated protein